MTFDESERSDWPSPSWFRKISAQKSDDEEELSRESVGFTTKNLEETRSIYDRNSGITRTEVRNGICSTCLFVVEKNNSGQCIFGEQLCRNCAKPILKRSICRSHVESQIASKEESLVILGVAADIDLKEMKRISGFSEDEVKNLKERLVGKGLLTRPGSGLLGKKSRPTQYCSQLLQTLLTTYVDDIDFSFCAKELGFYRYVETGKAQQ